MQELPEKPTGVALLITATRLTVQNWRYLAWVSGPMYAVTMSLADITRHLIEGDISSPPTWPFLALAFVTMVLVVLILSANAIGWHRLLARHSAQTTPMSVLRRLPYWSYIWRAGLLCVPAFGVAIAIGMPIHLISPPIWGTDLPIGSLPYRIVFYLEIYFRDWLVPFLISGTITLIGFGFPAVALGHKVPLWHAIKSSLSYAPQMMIALVLLDITTFAVVEVAGTQLRDLFFDVTTQTSIPFDWGAAILSSLISVFVTMINLAILTCTYLHWIAQQKRPAEADLLNVFS
ncbi:hypothetical protein [Tateyamaria sp.]|uniref:hypothetical protein n=1 Tax=Tateyamaria sp. TaxID=1929288 RepID=UPI0032A08A04